MGDIKLFAKSKKQVDSLVQTVFVPKTDMEIKIFKCTVQQSREENQ